MRIGRRFAVRVAAWSLRDKRGHGHPRLSVAEVEQALEKAFPHRDALWRKTILEEAQARNALAVRL